MPSARSRPQPDVALRRAPFIARELRLASDPSELVRVRAYVSDAASEFGFDDDARREFVFAANEAVTNAIRHGTPERDGTILVRIAADDELLTLDVSDTGPFVADVADRDPLAEGGRGFTLMTRLVDEIQLSIGHRHTNLRLGKRRPA